MEDFDYFEPETLAEASRILASYHGKARVLAGGTDLVPRMQRGLLSPRALVNIKKVKGLKEIRYRKGRGLTIGPLVTFNELMASKVVKRSFRPLHDLCGKIATPSVRNLATVAGNLSNAAPSADSAPMLMVLGSKVSIYCPRGRKRTLSLEDYFRGPGSTACSPGEILRSIMVPDIRPRTGAAYKKHKLREALDIAVVGVAAMVRTDRKGTKVEDARIVVGACAPIPLRIPKAEVRIIGEDIGPGPIDAAARIASEAIRPITDVRGTIEYRKEMTMVRTKEALVESIKQATGSSVMEEVQ